MKKRVLEVNVDDQNSGGVFSLVRNVIIHNNSTIGIDIAAIEKFTNPQNIEYLEGFDCHVHYVGHDGNKIGKQIHVYKNLKKLLRNHSYEYVHIHADTANKLLVSGLAAKHAKIKNIILHSHSSGVEGNSKIKTLVHKICSYRLKYIGTKLVACSIVAAKWMYPNAEKVVLLKNGIPLDDFQFKEQIRRSVRAKLGINDNEILLGHVGRLMAPKNHEYLFAILKQMEDQNIPAKLLIVGEGYKEEELKLLAQHMGISKNVIFYGISNKVNELLMAMDVFCLPSFFEGFPIVGVEAQASGLPVVFSTNVTKEAKITEHVAFLPIEADDINTWIETIIHSVRHHNREDGCGLVRSQGFDIADTVVDFITLYK